MLCADITCALFANIPPTPPHTHIGYTSTNKLLHVLHNVELQHAAIFCTTLPYFKSQQQSFSVCTAFPYFKSEQLPYFVQLCLIPRHMSRPHTISIQALCHLFAGITAIMANWQCHTRRCHQPHKAGMKWKESWKNSCDQLPYYAKLHEYYRKDPV